MGKNSRAEARAAGAPSPRPRALLSYRHAFHAGSHADVLKHVVWVQLLLRLTRKEKPLFIVDTHAGAGAYPLRHGYAAELAEYATGIARLWSRRGLPAPIDDYLREVGRANPDGTLATYPGSPQLAWQLAREQDRLRFFERHTSDARALALRFRGAGHRVIVTAGDGFAGLKALLPPPSRRGLVLVDPSYELKTDFAAVRDALADALARFATGTYAVWYPLLQRADAGRLPDRLQRLAPASWFDVRLQVKAPSPGGLGLHGSGMFVVNPPWRLAADLRAAMPALLEALRQDGDARYSLESRER